MDLSDPTSAVTSALDGPVLAVLARVGRPLTVGQVAADAARGSEIGIRRTLARLVDQGLVRSTLMGRNHVYELNRDHVAAGVADLLAGLRLELIDRFRKEVSAWEPPPLYAAIFGSTARGDGDAASDIDVVLVHPPLHDERFPAVRPHWLQAAELVISNLSTSKLLPIDPTIWQEQVDGLRDKGQRWTGNPLQVVDLSIYEYLTPTPSQARLLDEIDREAVDLFKVRGLPRHGQVAPAHA